VSKDGLVLNVVNNSSHDLHWVGDGNGPDPTSTPKDTIPANGGTDRIVFSGTNLQIQPTWQVAGTQKNVFPSFAVPLFGGNGADCTVDDISQQSPVGITHCDIGHGYDPDAHVTFGDKSLTVSKAGLVLNVVNNSSHDLHWVGDGNGPDPTSTPKDTIPANGGTDRIVFSGTNLQIQPTWQVAGTQKNVFPSFGVPLVGFNGFSCTVDDISKGSPVGMTHCDIGKGYDPDAHVTFGNAPGSASIPKDS
jgi:hypothetical protein